MAFKATKTRVFIVFLMSYVLIACTWWAYLLFQKNNELFNVKKDLLKKELLLEGTYNKDSFVESVPYLALEKKHSRQLRMIISEALVFFVILTIGILVVTRGLRKEVALAQQQRNFLLSITHELKSPLAGIRLVLETFFKRELTEKQRKKLSSNALKDSERLQELVNNILMAAKIENSYHWHREEIDLAQLIKSLLPRLKQKYPEVNFTSAFSQKVSSIKADQMGITSVILNLLENAVKYSGKSEKINVSLKQDRNNLLLAIEDNGIGIPDNEKNKIFEKFYRIGNEDTRETKGTGLGLFIVKEIIKAHDGNIIVKNNTPKGSIFQVSLPTT